MEITLAILGGDPVRTRRWPAWPQSTPDTLALLEQVVESGRWAISAPYNGVRSFERQFSDAFAHFHQSGYCIPTASGTASLMVALEACGVGAGDEVVIPGVTWVANASAVAAINARPVLADIDPQTMCMDPHSAATCIGPRTKAIVVVHLYSAVADLDALAALTERHGITLIEDCAQAHGARYRGRPVGTVGALGTFSMQATKVLTCGEGGAVITDDAVLARRVEHLRADGRTYAGQDPPIGALELVETAEIMGHNLCLSEFQAAVLVAQLPLLDKQNETRARNAAALDNLLTGLGLTPQTTSPETTGRTYYHYAVQLPQDFAAEVDLDAVATALSAELGLAVSRPYCPLNANRLYRPASRRRFAGLEGAAAGLTAVAPNELPVSDLVTARTLTFHHAALLGNEGDMADIATAFAKVLENRSALRKAG